MPPKPRKKSAKAPAPLVDPDISDALAACKEAKIATRRLNEMTESDPGVGEQTAKAAAAQWTLIEAGTNLATRQLLERPSLPEESHEVQLGLLKLGDLLQQYRKAEIDLVKTQYTVYPADADGCQVSCGGWYQGRWIPGGQAMSSICQGRRGWAESA